MPEKHWNAKITSVGKLHPSGDAQIYFDIYKGTDLIAKELFVFGNSKETIKDEIRGILRKYKNKDNELRGIEIGDIITIGG